MVSKKYLMSVLLTAITLCSEAQFRLPQLDVEAKGVFSILPDNSDNSTIKNVTVSSWQGGAHVQLNQYIALGGFYTRSFSGNVKYQNDEPGSAQMLIKGLDLRFSGGRSARWRPYISFNYSQVEFTQNFGGINLANKANAIGAGMGLMRKLSNNLYWSIIEVNYKKLNTPIFWLDNMDFMLEAKSGFVYNIRVKTK